MCVCVFTLTHTHIPNTQQVLNDIELLCGECVKKRAPGARAPDVLLEHIRIYHNLISNVSSLRFLMSCKERQRRSTGKEASIEDRLVILELQNRYLQVMLSSLSLCPSSTSTSESEKKKRKRSQNQKYNERKVRFSYLELWNIWEKVVDTWVEVSRRHGMSFVQVVLSGTKKKTDPKPKSFVFLRGFTIKLDEADDCVFTLLRPEKSTWDRNVQVRVGKKVSDLDGSRRVRRV